MFIYRLVYSYVEIPTICRNNYIAICYTYLDKNRYRQQTYNIAVCTTFP